MWPNKKITIIIITGFKLVWKPVSAISSAAASCHKVDEGKDLAKCELSADT